MKTRTKIFAVAYVATGVVLLEAAHKYFEESGQKPLSRDLSYWFTVTTWPYAFFRGVGSAIGAIIKEETSTSDSERNLKAVPNA